MMFRLLMLLFWGGSLSLGLCLGPCPDTDDSDEWGTHTKSERKFLNMILPGVTTSTFDTHLFVDQFVWVAFVFFFSFVALCVHCPYKQYMRSRELLLAVVLWRGFIISSTGKLCPLLVFPSMAHVLQQL